MTGYTLHVRPVWLLAFLSACAFTACARPAARSVDAGSPGPADGGPPVPPEHVRIESIRLEPTPWPPGAGTAPEGHALEERIALDLTTSKVFELAPGAVAVAVAVAVDKGTPAPPPAEGVKRARLKAAYGVEVAPASKKTPGIVRAAVTMTLEWMGDGEDVDLWENFACDAEVPSGEGKLGETARKMVDCALTRAVGGLVDKERVRQGDEKAVAAALESGDGDLRAVAFTTIADRRLRSNVPRLIEMLKSDDVMTRDGALGALVALREGRAVKPLIDMVEFNDIGMMRRVVDAVGSIGGDEARAYLELVASGHDVPDIRELARQALERMDRREAKATPTPRRP